MVVAVLFLATMFYGLGYRGVKGMKENTKKDSIATVDGKEIDHKRYQQALSKMFAAQKERIEPETAMLIQTTALGQEIDYMIMLDASKKHFGASGQEVNQAIDQIMAMNKIPSQQVLEEALQKNLGMSLDDFKESVKNEIIISKMTNSIKAEVAMTPDDLREVKARHILIMPRGTDSKADFEARARAEGILAELKKGGNFKTLAMKYSDDAGSAKNGGEIGYFTTGTMVPEFEKAAFVLKPGELSDVVKTSYGYHIIQVEDTRLRKIDTKGKDMAQVILEEKQNLALQKWMFDLKSKAKIEINEPLIQAHMLLMKGKINEAIAQYDQASMDNPSNAYIHLFLGDAYMKTGNNEFALSEYSKAAELSGADAGLLIAVGDVFLKMNKKPMALQQYRKASMIAGDDKKMHQELKDVFKKMKASSDAAKEQAEITRLEKKEKFEEDIKKKMGGS